MTPEERITIASVTNWLDEHRNFISPAVIEGYAGVIDWLDSLLPAGTRDVPVILSGPFEHDFPGDGSIPELRIVPRRIVYRVGPWTPAPKTPPLLVFGPLQDAPNEERLKERGGASAEEPDQ